MSVRLNIGCGTTPTEGWLNMDNSLAIKLANSPLSYKLAKLCGLLTSQQIENIEWNKSNKIQFADATKSLPLKNSSVDCIYTSHMFEHLSQEGARKFLAEARRVLESGGVLRISVPDLGIAIKEYLDSSDADLFMRSMLVEAPPISTLKQKVSLLAAGYRHHQWMYDGQSLSKLLTEMGFKDVEICEKGYTKISDAFGLDLYERFEQSVYVEGVK